METQAQLLVQRPSAIQRSAIVFSTAFTAFFAFFSMNSISSFALPIVQYWENRTGPHSGLVLDPRVSYYYTNSNYDKTSHSTPLPFDATVSQIYFDLNASYGFTDNWFLFGRLSVINTRLNNPQAPLTSSPNSSIFGMGDQLIGFAGRLLHADNGLNFNIQAETSIPAYNDNNQKASQQPYLGDQSYDMTFGGFLEIPIPPGATAEWYLEAGTGYTYRSAGFSAAVPYSLMLKRDPIEHGAVFSLGARGQFSLNTDKIASVTNQNDQNVGGAGSNIIYAQNPSFTIAQITLGYKNGSGQTLYAAAAYPVVGTNSPLGFQVTLGAQLDFGGKSKSSDESETAITEKKLARPDHFTSYDLEATVQAVNDNFHVIRLNKGSDDDVQKGQYFDIFKMSEDPLTQKKTETVIARAKVTHVKGDESALNVVEYFIDQWIEKGFTARRIVQ